MHTMQIPGTDLITSEVIMGNFRMQYLPDKPQRDAFLKAALDAGITTFDHSDVYGSSNPLGRSDELFAQSIDLSSSIRNKLVIQSKVGSVFVHEDGVRYGIHDLSRSHIVDSVEGSLRRLNTDYLDVLLLHRTDPLMEPEEVAAAFDELHSSGKVRYFGVSSSTPMRMEFLKKYLNQPLVVHQTHISLIDTAAIDFTTNLVGYKGPVETFDPGAGTLDYCRMHNIQIQSWSPLTFHSKLGQKFNPSRPHPFVHFVDDYIQFGPLNQKLDEIGEHYGIPKSGVVMAWYLSHPAHIQPVVGSTNPARIQELATGSGVRLTREEWYSLYHITSDVLV